MKCENEGKCDPESCRYWIDYPEDDNCALVSIEKHGAMTLREVAKRMQISFVRVKQIEDAALAKLAKRLSADCKVPLSELKGLLCP